MSDEQWCISKGGRDELEEAFDYAKNIINDQLTFSEDQIITINNALDVIKMAVFMQIVRARKLTVDKLNELEAKIDEQNKTP